MAYNMSGNSFGTSTQQFNGGPNNSSFLNGSTSFLQEASTSSWQADELDRMSTLLSKKLGPEFLSQRVGGGGAKLTYIEGWRVINIANEVFGFSGWSSEIKHLDIDFVSPRVSFSSRWEWFLAHPGCCEDRCQSGDTTFHRQLLCHCPCYRQKWGFPRGCWIWQMRKCEVKS